MKTMLSSRRPNTAKAMADSGNWAKVGPKHYIHISGEEITYNCNRWLWIHGNYGYTTLWAAKHNAEMTAAVKIGLLG